VPDWISKNQGHAFPRVPEQDWPQHACFLENAMVLPAARGRGFQRKLLGARLVHIAATDLRWICAGVHLQNTVSWANLIASGMRIVGIRTDRGYPTLGLLRSADGSGLETDDNDRAYVHVGNATEHEAILKEGYIGAHVNSSGSVVYQRLSGAK